MTSQPQTTLSSPFGDVQLERFPKQSNRRQRQEPLRAWDAADEYLLAHVAAQALHANARVAIINDGFGALAVALHRFKPCLFSDSYIAQQAYLQNMRDNQLEDESVSPQSSLELSANNSLELAVNNSLGLSTANSLELASAEQSTESRFDLVLIKVPKTLALLEDQLYRLRAHIDNHTIIIAAGMTKNIHNSTSALFENILGPTTTSLAKKKARLIFCQPQASLWSGVSPYPSHYPLEDTRFQLTNHANVFSRASLDIGTRLLLKHIHELPAANTIVDLGCGNGVIGLLAAEQRPNAKLIFTDESFMAVASAQANFEQAFGGEREVQYSVNNCLDDMPSDSVDLVLNNPPFHQQGALAEHIARQMFSDAKRVLNPGGEIWVIANRHLGYHVQLKRLFGNCQTLVSNKKFVLLKASKR